MKAKYDTQQKVFNKVARHLLTQKKVSRSSNGQCLYKGPKGLSCAIGCLIEDRFYDPDMEGQWIFHYKTTLSKSGVKASAENIQLLNDLRVIHDDFPPRLWRQKLMDLAKERGLRATVLKDFQ